MPFSENALSTMAEAANSEAMVMPTTVVMGIAAWVRYLGGIDEQRRPFPVAVPLADEDPGSR